MKVLCRRFLLGRWLMNLTGVGHLPAVAGAAMNANLTFVQKVSFHPSMWTCTIQVRVQGHIPTR